MPGAPSQTVRRGWRGVLLLSLTVPLAGASLVQRQMTAAELEAQLGTEQFEVCRLHPQPAKDD